MGSPLRGQSWRPVRDVLRFFAVMYLILRLLQGPQHTVPRNGVGVTVHTDGSGTVTTQESRVQGPLDLELGYLGPQNRQIRGRY